MNFSYLPTTANGIELQTINAIQFPGTSLGGRTLHTLRWINAVCSSVAGLEKEAFQNRFPECMREMHLVQQDAAYIVQVIARIDWLQGPALDDVDVKEFAPHAEQLQTAIWIFSNMASDLKDGRSADQHMGANMALRDAYKALDDVLFAS